MCSRVLQQPGAPSAVRLGDAGSSSGTRSARAGAPCQKPRGPCNDRRPWRGLKDYDYTFLLGDVEMSPFFPRASERRALRKVKVCHHIFSSSHLLIFSSSLLHIFTSSQLHIFSLLPSCPLALLLSCFLAFLPSCPLALLPSSLFFLSISLLRRGAVPTRRHEMQPFRTKRGSIVKRCDLFARNEIRSAKIRTK